MASPGSFIRSAARVTFSAYRSVPIRWRLAGGSAALTLVILAGFAVLVGHFADQQVRESFYAQVNGAATQQPLNVTPHGTLVCDPRDLGPFAAADNAQIRVIDNATGNVLCDQNGRVRPNKAATVTPFLYPDIRSQGGWYVATERITWRQGHKQHSGSLLYARQVATIDHTINRVQLVLVLGVLGGTVLALLAGLATAQRAIRPIAQLTAAAREIARTRDPSRRIPHVEAKDEVSELAATLAGMLGALDESRGETELALRRQREFVADASHELRTPLTSVLANLELLADELAGEQAESAKAALRSTRRMRRLVGDLLLLARADAQRLSPPRAPTDLAAVLTDAAAELGPVTEDHEITIDAAPAMVVGTRDDLHRLILNLIENAVRHTPPGTSVRAATAGSEDAATLVVEDDGPGIPPELRRHVFERFVRLGGDTRNSARGTGLGLAIVRAVADSHGATVTLGAKPDGTGTRFEIAFPKPVSPKATGAGEDAGEHDQTSTTTGNTIGRRRNLS